MAGTLFVVGTPIGNLDDMTFRAVKTLLDVDFICAEDTRVTAKLLNHFKIKKPTVSYHEHNARQSGATILNRLLNGESCAVVTDAGMPCISDPGEDLVKLCAENGVDVKVVPGPSAAVSALAVSGLDTKRFCFEGFLSVNKKSRAEHLESASKIRETLIFYEAPHKLVYTLADMLEAFGDRRISLCRELTKIHEEVIRTTLSGALEYYGDKTPKGEYVLIIEGAKEAKKALGIDDVLPKLKELINGGMRTSDACKLCAKESGFSKSELYAAVLHDE